jgi:hypothetical protein
MPTSRPTLDAVEVAASSSITAAWAVENSWPFTNTLPNAEIVPVDTAPAEVADKSAAPALPVAGLPAPPPLAASPKVNTSALAHARPPTSLLFMTILQVARGPGGQR